MKPDRQDALLCRLHEARQALNAALRAARKGDVEQARSAAHSVQLGAQRAADIANERIEVTQRVVVESWHRRPDENGYGSERSATLTHDTYCEYPPQGLLVTGYGAVFQQLRRIFALD